MGSPRPPLEVADIVRRHGARYRATHPVSLAQERVLDDIARCRTAALGGHVEVCDRCSERRIAYNSCRNRHCPKCQSLAKERWLQARRAELLPVEYFHVVFTLPADLAELALLDARLLYDLLFAAAAETLLTLAADPKHLGADIGFIAVLHTWGQNLMLHPHLHLIVPGGGLSPDGERWVCSRPGFLLPVRVLSRLFRRLFLDRLAACQHRGELHTPPALQQPRAFEDLLERLRQTEWVVYAKRPFAGPQAVLDYLGRYTHRVAISNERLMALADGEVTFRYKDYRHRGRRRSMTIHAEEFLRRFLLHTLPKGLVRIRHYGLLANRHRTAKLERARALLAEPPAAAPTALAWPALVEQLTGRNPLHCPVCRQGTFIIVATVAPDPSATVDSS